MRHMLGIAAATALIILCTLLPFLPGRYDGMAVPLSAMAQVVGTVGLVLVPVGALWMAAERLQWLGAQRYAFRLLALIVSSFVWALVVLVAMVQSGFALGFVALAVWVCVVRRAWSLLIRPGGITPRSLRALPLYLVVMPVAVALLQYTLVERAVTFSRDKAIRNSIPLIAAIEHYRTRYGRYPASLLSVNPDYWPGVIGVPKYHYELNGDSYNLFFEQFTYRLGTQEFVMYNPRDEHVMTSHAMDLLELTPEQLELERTRGHYALHDAPHSHWKYFWFD